MKTIGKAMIFMALVLGGNTAMAQRQINPEAKMHKYSTTIEKERPKLNPETQALISAYRRNPSTANYEALKVQVGKNYDAVLARKKAKLEDLKQTARDASKVEEMQKIVDEMIADREHRIGQSMARFTDRRMRPGTSNHTDGFVPLRGAAENISIAYTPVTNQEYALFDKNFTYAKGTEQHPAVNISYNQAVAYCQWRSGNDGNTYRLPTAEEWELAAGHMPKDADFNCGVGHSTTPVTTYKQTPGACGGIDFWGNCWEWTSTSITATTGRDKGSNVNQVKGGSWNVHRTECRTENRSECRNPDKGYSTVGFRIVRVG